MKHVLIKHCEPFPGLHGSPGRPRGQSGGPGGNVSTLAVMLREPEDGMRRYGREEQEKTSSGQLSRVSLKGLLQVTDQPTLPLHPEAELSPRPLCFPQHPHALLYVLSVLTICP